MTIYERIQLLSLTVAVIVLSNVILVCTPVKRVLLKLLNDPQEPIITDMRFSTEIKYSDEYTQNCKW